MPSEVSAATGDQSVEALRRELAQALEQQAATAAILAVISSSPLDPQRVFAEIAASAARLCDAYDAMIFQVDGSSLRLVAHHGSIPAGPIGQFTLALTREVTLSRAILERRTIHVADLQAETDEYPEGSGRAQDLGVRTVLNVPLIRAGKTIGVIGIRRTEVRWFSGKQIALLETFANQAVIAIENTRLFEAEQTRTRELTEALEQQTATSEVLQVISSSPGELEPVFQAMLGNAMRICEAKYGNMFEFADGAFRALSSRGVPPEFAEYVAHKRVWGPETGLGQVALTKQPVHIVDTLTDRAYAKGDPDRIAAIEIGGVRTFVVVPMLKEGELIGAISLYRTEVRPFSNKQVQLVASFASQAVIAIENTRLLNELRESLQQQTATADVLKVISRATFDLPRVLDTLVESAATLCDSYDTAITQKDGDVLRIVSRRGHIPSVGAATGGIVPLTRGGAVGRSVLDRRTIHVADMQAETEEYPEGSDRAQRLGFHTILVVPLIRAGEAIGAIVNRRTEVRPFTDRQVELLKTFADQAVIAIENTRLFEEVQARSKELAEALERQTATSEVLSVISGSHGKLDPVFQAMLENATRICEASFGTMWLSEGDGFRPVALQGVPPALAEERRPELVVRPTPEDAPLTRLARTKQPLHIPDIRTDQSYLGGDRLIVALADLGGARTVLGVPILKEGELIGALTIYRQEVRLFTDKQIELVTNFADQAVIAIENTRLFEAEQTRTHELTERTQELTETLEYQTATSEVLNVIGRSPTDVKPVFETIAKSAALLCRARFCHVFRFDGELIQFVASQGLTVEAAEMLRRAYPMRPSRASISARAILSGAVEEIPEVDADPEYQHAPIARALGYGSVVAAPMLKDGRPIGALVVGRSEIGRFPERQIDLLKTFADQAVIAIENTRLFEEVQARNSELRIALEQQTATSEVLNVISRSKFELQPVFDTIIASAVKLCNARQGAVYRFDGELVHLAAPYNYPPAILEILGRMYPRPPQPDQVSGRAILNRR